MNNVCKVNQNITDKFKHLDDEQYQQEYDEHCRKMSIIDSYEEEIKEVLFLSSGCVDTSSYSYKEYGLGLSPDYVNSIYLIDSVQHLKAEKLGLDYKPYHPYVVSGFTGKTEDKESYSLSFIKGTSNKEYLDYFLSIVNKYSKEFYGKEYFTRWEGVMFDYTLILVTTKETWKQEYLRNEDTLHSWKGFTIATLIPIFGWYFVLYSMYEAVRLYIKHKGE